jgi:hypothetical protein
MKEEIVKFWESNPNVLDRYTEDYGLNGADYIMSIDDIDELEEILMDYLEEED